MKQVFSWPVIVPAALLVLSGSTLKAQELPEGHGREQTMKLCAQCHELARSISPRQDRAGWSTTMTKMAAFGMKSSPEEYNLVLDYLVTTYPAEDVPKVNVNTATAIELESGLTLRRSQAAALIKYRKEHGAFKTLDDLKKVPLLEPDKIDAKKDRIAF
jgi:competence protein ComEA